MSAVMVGESPVGVGHFDIHLPEVMYYLYLPVMMFPHAGIRLPPNVACCAPLVLEAMDVAIAEGRSWKYAYLSARKGWATPDNPLNRPGWHCDGFGTDDMNFVWWRGPGTRFLPVKVMVPADHLTSLDAFDKMAQAFPERIFSPPEATLYAISPRVVHATPLVGAPGCMRQYVKISLSNERYNLENNSHNYLFNYDWPLHSRDLIRNDPHRAQGDSVPSDVGEKINTGPT